MTTRRERLENKLQKRLDWAAARAQAADREFEKADLREEKSGIPFGQPILVGHHSERRHRNAIRRADSAMRRSIEHSDMSRHHAAKADGIERQLNNSIFSDDPDALEQLEAKIAKLEREREVNNAVNKIIRRKPKEQRTEAKIAELCALGISEATADKLFEPDFCGRVGIPSYVNQNLGSRIKAAKDRLTTIKRRQERTEAAESNGGVSIEGGDYVSITFAEKPEREILNALGTAGFRWGNGSWSGRREAIPACVAELIEGEPCSEPIPQ